MRSDLPPQDALSLLHHKTGEVLRLCSRMMAAVVVLGTVFCLLLTGVVHVLQHPARVLKTQAFMVNQLETMETKKMLQQELARNANDDRTAQAPLLHDPNWDGLLAGAGAGWTLGRSVPVLGAILGPAVGAWMGYQLDARVE